MNKIIHPDSNKITSIDILTIYQKFVTNIEEISNEIIIPLLRFLIYVNQLQAPLADYKSFIIGNYREFFFFWQVTANSIWQVINNANNKFCHTDSIPNYVIKTVG